MAPDNQPVCAGCLGQVSDLHFPAFFKSPIFPPFSNPRFPAKFLELLPHSRLTERSAVLTVAGRCVLKTVVEPHQNIKLSAVCLEKEAKNPVFRSERRELSINECVSQIFVFSKSFCCTHTSNEGPGENPI
jgi:hypothetical protein